MATTANKPTLHIYVVGSGGVGKTTYIKCVLGMHPVVEAQINEKFAKALTREGVLVEGNGNIRLHELCSLDALPPPDTHEAMYVAYMVPAAGHGTEAQARRLKTAAVLRNTYNVFVLVNADLQDADGGDAKVIVDAFNAEFAAQDSPKLGRAYEISVQRRLNIYSIMTVAIHDTLNITSAVEFQKELTLDSLIQTLMTVRQSHGDVAIGIKGSDSEPPRPCFGMSFIPTHPALDKNRKYASDTEVQELLVIGPE